MPEGRLASPKLTPGWCPAAFPHPTATLPDPVLAEAAVQGAAPLPPPLLHLGAVLCEAGGTVTDTRLSPLCYFCRISSELPGRLSWRRPSSVPSPQGFTRCEPQGAAGCGWHRGLRAQRPTRRCTGDQHLRGILALTLVAFFKIHWNLTAKPTSISAPERFSSLRASVAAVTLF